jgi:hypothetical protein
VKVEFYLAVISTLGVWLGSSQQTPTKLAPRDFVVAGITHATDSAAVRQQLGQPDSVTVSDHPFDVGGKLMDWWYSGLRISYNGAPTVASFWLTGHRFTTARGVHVGDSRARVRQVYGEPKVENEGGNAWVYEDPDDPLHLVKFWFKDGVVQSVFVGRPLD